MSAKCHKRTFVLPLLLIARLCSSKISDTCATWLDPFGEPLSRIWYRRFHSMFIKKSLLAATLTAALAFTASAVAQEEKPKPQILFTKVNIFDGKSDKLAEDMSVLVEGNLIKQIGKGLKAVDGAKVIDGGGRTLMPGLIETHAHLVLTGPNLSAIEAMDWGQIAYASVPNAEMYLMEGFTTVRDAGGAPAAKIGRAHV